MRRPRRRAAIAGPAGLLLLSVLAALLARQPAGGPGLFGSAAGLPAVTRPEPFTLPPPSPLVPTPEPLVPSSVAAPTPPPPAPAPATPAPSPANLVAPTTQADFLARVQREALRQVTANGLPAYGVVGGGWLRGAGMVAGPLPPGTAPAAAAGPMPGGAGGASSAAPPTSGTNVQEVGVDEPDLAKTDGRLLVSLRGRSLEVVDVTGAPRPIASLPLPAGAHPTSALLVGSRALVFSSVAATGAQRWEQTDAVVVELTDPARPTIVRGHRLAGRLVSARLLDGTVRVVLASSPQITWAFPVEGSRRAQDAALAENRRRIRTSTFEQWVPPGTGCRNAYTSPVESGLATIAVRSIDPAAASAGPGVCVASEASTVYASTASLYVGTTTFEVARAVAEGLAGIDPSTSLHRFDIRDPASARYTGSGEVAGTLLNQFSLSEHGGDLRVATTSGVATGSESQVAVLRPTGPALHQVGLLGGLGRTERIFAVRFVGDLGYVVTFSQALCDPLFVVDLTDPTRPRLRGSLEVQGFSSYLHPAGPSRLVSIGRDAPGGRAPAAPCATTSPQVSLYDVGQPDQPRQLQRLVLPPGSSEAERDHHAFTYWAPTRMLLIPLSLSGPAFEGAVALRVEDGGITEIGRITHPSASSTGRTAIRRSFVVGSRLLTVSDRGVASHDLSALADQGFAAF